MSSTSRCPRALVLALVLSLSAVCPAAAAESGDRPIEFRREWVWTTFGRPIGLGGMEIVDLDGDGANELVATADAADSYGVSPRWFQARWAGALRQTWSSLAYPEGLWFLRVTGPPGAREILIADADEIFVHPPATENPTRVIQTSALGMTALEVGDIDGQGGPEIVVCDGQALLVYDYLSGDELAVRYGFGCTDLDLGQTDGDPALEIALGGNAFGGILLDGATLQADWVYLDGFGARVLLTDADHDGLDEVVGTTSDDSHLQAVDPAAGVLWQVPADQLGPFLAADLDDSGDEEIVYFASYPYALRALEETTGMPVWTRPISTDWVESLAAGDVDFDGHVDLAWSQAADYGGESRLLFMDAATGQLKPESEGLSGPFHGLHVADLDADGTTEVVATSWSSYSETGDSGGRHLLFDAATHELERLSPALPGGYYYEWTGTRRTLVLQLDADPQPEICTAFDVYYDESFVRCEDGESFALEWQVSLPLGWVATSLAPAELDSDPQPELVVATNASCLFVLEAENGWLKYQTAPLGASAEFYILHVGDVLGDAAPELVASTADIYYDPLTIFDGATGALLRGPWNLAIGSFDLAQLDADAQLEIVTGGADGRIAVLDAASGQLGPELATFGGPVYALRVADTTLDGAADFNVVAGSVLAVWGGAENEVVWSSPYLGEDAGRLDTLWVDDFDLDGNLDLAVNTGYGFAIFEAPLLRIFRDGFEAGDTSAWTAVLP